MAIKSMQFQNKDPSTQLEHVSREAAIAYALVHNNIVATYSTEVCGADEDGQQVAPSSSDLAVYKFHLVQVRISHTALAHTVPALHIGSLFLSVQVWCVHVSRL